MIIFNYLLMCAIFGTTFLSIKIGVEAGLPPFFSAGIRFLLAGLLIFLWMLWKKKVKLSLLLHKEFMLIGLASTFMTFAALYWAEQHIDSGIAAILSATGPMMILMLQTVVMRKPANCSDFIGCGIGFAGVLLLILPKLVLGSNAIWVWSCIVVLLGELGYAAGSLYTRKVMLRIKDTSSVAINSVQMLYGGMALVVLSLFTEHMNEFPLQSFPALGSLMYLIIVGSMLGHSLYAWLLKATNAVFPSTWLYISPVIAMGLGAIVYGESVSAYSVVGTALILSGIIVTNLHELRLLKTRRSARSAA
ncbi:DMT family transporter [Paenibacillus allorhizosphaerae]|uniref:Inner membrane transporter YedA n=1 Tax=Paenibacillus allorhizosphaerae TaxID=2849866 RepID=A0ABM8VA11_9BACL|nr:EamA family transporter [Paenibacillus allorhizosphaerae]CAG7615036.1 putative inner membrane transporter YedA [Paenibacillus allorhizosphaerae]